MTLSIALWGSAGLSNVGDRLISLIVRDELRRRIDDCRIDLFSPWVGGHETDGGPVRHLGLDPDGSWSLSDAYEAVVVPGGGVFAGPPFLHPIMKTFCLGDDPAVLAPALFTAWHAVGVQDDSPEPDAAPQWAYLRALRNRLDRCTARDPDAARRIGSAVGLPAPTIAADPVFALAPLVRTRAGTRRPIIGVSVGIAPVSASLVDTTINGTHAWRLCLAPAETGARMARSAETRSRTRRMLAQALVELSDQVDLIIIGIRNMYGDGTLATHLAAALPDARCVLLDVCDHDELTALYGTCNLVLASRYHSAVLALRAGTPVIGVDTSAMIGPSKMRSLLAQLGVADRYWGPTATARQLVEIVSAVLGATEFLDQAADGYQAMHTRAVADLAGLAFDIAAEVGQRGR